MAGRGNVRVSITAETGGFHRPIAQVEKSLDQLKHHAGETFKEFHKSVVGGVAGLVGAGGLVAGLEESVRAAVNAQAAQAKLGVAVKNAGISWGAHREEIEKWLQKQSAAKGFMERDLSDAFANMIRTTHSVRDAQTLLNEAQDVARTRNMSLATAQQTLARVYNGSFIGLKKLGIAITPVTTAHDALSRSLTKVTDAQKAQAKASDAAATRSEALRKVYEAFHGQADKFAHTTAGQMQIARANFEELEVTIGTKLLPYITQAVVAVNNFVTQFREGTGQGGKFRDVLQQIGDRIAPIIKFFKDHPKLIAIAVGAWASYRVAAMAALAITRAKLIGQFLGLGRQAAIGGTEAGTAFGTSFGATAGAVARTAFLGAFTAGLAVALGYAIDQSVKRVQNNQGNIGVPGGLVPDWLANLITGGPKKARQPRDRFASPTGAPMDVPSANVQYPGHYSKGQLEALWIRAGGDPKAANTAAAIALAESSGDPTRRNSIGATGLWQIYNGPNTSHSLLDPMANARAAVAKYKAAGGFSPWTTYTGADTGPGGGPGPKTYLQYLGGDGGASSLPTSVSLGPPEKYVGHKRYGPGGVVETWRPSVKRYMTDADWTAYQDLHSGRAGRSGRAAAPITMLDRLESGAALAALTPSLGDDIKNAQQQVRYWEKRLASARRAGNPVHIKAAADGLKNARANLHALHQQRSDARKAATDRAAQRSATASQQELEDLQYGLDAASLTDTTSDDIAAQSKIVAYWTRRLAAAQARGDKAGIREATVGLRGATLDLTRMRQDAATTAGAGADSSDQALKDNTQALKDLADQMKRQNDFAVSVANVTSREAVRAMADVISGQIVGYGVRPRMATAGSGVGARY